MKLAVIITIDPDKILEVHPKAEDLADAVAREFSYSMGNGYLEIEDLNRVFEPDEIPSNDSELGALIRNQLND